MSDFGFGPGGIDCDDVLRDVYLYLDDETDGDRHYIQTEPWIGYRFTPGE